MRILLVDDDETLMTSLAQRLIRQRYAVDIAVDGSSAQDYVELFNYDLIVLDLMLPDGDGIEFCQQFRRDGYINPLMILTAKASTPEKVSALDAGADDYVIKPFDFEELCARIRALLRREHEGLPTVLQWGALQLNPSDAELTYLNQLVRLTPKELSLMELFLRHPYRVHSLSSIIDALWPLETPPGEDAVRTHVKSLRRKLCQAGAPKALIKTVYGLGYRLNEEVLSDRAFNHHSPKESGQEKARKDSDLSKRNSQSLAEKVASEESVLSTQLTSIPINNKSPSSSHESSINLAPSAKHQLSAPDQSLVKCEPQVICHYLQTAQTLVAEIEQAALFLFSDTEQSPPRGRQQTYQKAQLEARLEEAQLEAQKKVHSNAHKLAGSLGSFGFVEGSNIAQQIELQIGAQIEAVLDSKTKHQHQNRGYQDRGYQDRGYQAHEYQTHEYQAHEYQAQTSEMRSQTASLHTATLQSSADIIQLIQQLREYIRAAAHQSAISSGSLHNTDRKLERAIATPATILLLSRDDTLIQRLTQAAAHSAPTAFISRILPATDIDIDIDTAINASTIQATLYDEPKPDLVIWDKTISASLEALTHESEQLLLEFMVRLPTIALVETVTLTEQRHLVEKGVNRVMHRSESPQRVLEEADRILRREHQGQQIIRVAIADDDPAVLSHLKTSLDTLNFSVSTFTNAQALWQWLHPAQRHNSPLCDRPLESSSAQALSARNKSDLPIADLPIADLLILDVEMPDIGGIELCRILRADAQFQQLPIIFLTVHHTEAIKNLAFQAGANDFVNKADCTPQELANRIHQQILRRCVCCV